MEPEKKKNEVSQTDVVADESQATYLSAEVNPEGTGGINPPESSATTPQAEQLEGVTETLDNLGLNTKRLSGAQRRKLAVEAAKAKGVSIKPRKTRANRKPKRLMQQNMVAGKPPGEETATLGSLQTQRMRGKRVRSEDEQSPSSTQDRAKKGRHEPAKEKPSTSAGVSYKAALTAVKLAIALETYPEAKLTADQAKKIQISLTKEIWKSKAGEGPQIVNSYPQSGVLFITCANNSSREWVLEKVPILKPWEGAKLRVGEARDVVRTVRVITWVPTDDLDTTEPKKILQLLEIQNKNLKTEDWRLINSQSEKKGITLVLAMTEENLKDLAARNYKAFVGLKEITFRPTKSQRVPNAEDAGNSNKPAA